MASGIRSKGDNYNHIARCSDEFGSSEMPLVILCGFPVSGKTTRANELCKYMSNHHAERKIHFISDHSLGVARNEVYSCSHKEREMRGSLKSSVQRCLNREDVVILDSLNYIKGFRYELYCVTKACQTTQCVIFCDTSKDRIVEWNDNRISAAGDSPDEAYDRDVLEGLVMRFEQPSPNNRWDSPLFVVQCDEPLPAHQVCSALFDRNALPPNQSTQSQPLSSTNFLYELDRVTQDVVTRIIDAQKTGVVGDLIPIKGASEQIMLTRTLTLGELQRHKRQFITYTKMHPVDDPGKLPNLFVQYLNNTLK